jgi:hypothetical protein
MRELWMVVRSSTDEFERDGVKAVRENVKSGHYGEPKKQQALMWLNEQKTKRKQFRDAKDLLTLARRTARDTRLTLVVAGLMLLILIAIVARLFVEQGIP